MKDELFDHLRLVRRMREKRLIDLQRDFRGTVEKTRRHVRAWTEVVVDPLSGERRVIFKPPQTLDGLAKSSEAPREFTTCSSQEPPSAERISSGSSK